MIFLAPPSGHPGIRTSHAKALEWDQDCDWNGILERLTAKEWHGNAKRKSFNNALVVELALEECRCDPTAEELKDLYEKFYSLPMSGKLDDAGMGGAQ